MSEIRANTFSDSAGTGPAALTGQWAAKADVTYDQVTPQIDRSNNVSSVTDNATGDFTVNFASSFAAATYGFSAGATSQGSSTTGDQYITRKSTATWLTGSADVYCQFGGASTIDEEYNAAQFWGDLA